MSSCIFKPSYPLETERLWLRPYEESDLEWFTELRQNEEVTQFLPFGRESDDEMPTILADRIAKRELLQAGDRIMCVLVCKATDQPVGDVMLAWETQWDQTGEVGYKLSPSHHGEGYATEAAALMLEFGFTAAGFHRIVGIANSRNAASHAVLRRLGMREEGCMRSASLVRGEWHDETVFAILEEEWRSKGIRKK